MPRNLWSREIRKFRTDVLANYSKSSHKIYKLYNENYIYFSKYVLSRLIFYII